MLPQSYLSLELQKERYLKHNNSLENDGYVQFLRSFIEPVLNSLPSKGKRLESILDYGSGPEPVLISILEAYRKEGRLDSACCIRGWDPFFSPDTAFFEDGADLVTCLEVAEHFEEPDKDFCKLASAIKKGGYLAVGTMLLPSGGRDAFKAWWYRSDATHVSFYTQKSLRIVTERYGLEWIATISDRAFLLRKS